MRDRPLAQRIRWPHHIRWTLRDACCETVGKLQRKMMGSGHLPCFTLPQYQMLYRVLTPVAVTGIYKALLMMMMMMMMMTTTTTTIDSLSKSRYDDAAFRIHSFKSVIKNAVTTYCCWPCVVVQVWVWWRRCFFKFTATSAVLQHLPPVDRERLTRSELVNENLYEKRKRERPRYTVQVHMTPPL